MVEALGGLYQPFDRLHLNPLDCEDSPINRQRLALLLRLMLGEAGQEPGIESVLSHVAETAFQLPVEARRFDTIFPLTFPAHSAVRQSFARWVTDPKGRSGLYAPVFNATRDSLSGFLDQSFLTGINMNEALEDPALGAPVVAHISTAIEQMAREGRAKGFAVFIDEAANLLRNPAFRDLAAVMYREYRKFGGIVGMAFQDPGALHRSGIAEAVIENTATFLFYPNPQGNRSAYEPFNLNDEQRAFIFGAPVGRKVLLVKRDAAQGLEESTILDVDLAPLGRALRFYRSGPDAVRELIELQATGGTQWRARL
jgi:type IV secretion system protein VirB4